MRSHIKAVMVMATVAFPFALTGCAAQGEMADGVTVTVPTELNTQQPGLLRAWQGTSPDAIGNYYAPHAVVVLPSGRLTGWDQIRTQWITPALPTMSGFTATPTGFTREGNDIIETGRYSYVATVDGRRENRSGVFAHRWQRQPDGSWRVVSATIQ